MRPKALPKPLEKDIQAMILDYLTLRRVFAWRTNAGAMQGHHKGKKWFFKFHSIDGVSDILGCFEGRLLCIETKRPGKNATESQQAFIDSVNRAGGLAFVARSVEDVRHELDEEARTVLDMGNHK